MKRVQEDLQNTAKRIAEETRQRTEAIQAERRTSEERDKAIERQLEDSVAGGLHLETMGVCWIAVGAITANLASELVGWLNLAY